MLSTFAGSWRLLTHRQKIGLSILTFLRTFAGGLDLVAIALVAFLVAMLTGNNLPLPVLEDFVSSSSGPLPLVLAIAAVVFLFKTVLGISLSRVTFRFLAKVETNASMKIVRSIFGQNLARLKNYARSELDWSISRSTGVLFGSILGHASTLLAEGTVAWMILIVFFIADWFAAGVVIVYFGLVLLVFQLLTRGVLDKSGKAVSAGSITISQAILDFFATFREINVAGRQAFFYQRIYESRASLAMGQARSNYMGAVPRLVIELALIAGALGLFAFENWRTNGDPDLLLISVFVIGSLRIMSALLPIHRAIMATQFLGPQASLARELLEEALREPLPVRVDIPQQDTEYLGLGIDLEITGATFRYGDAQEAPAALEQISMKVDSGSFVALIGPSGSGKSSLVDLVLGLHSPASGKVLYDGLPTNVYQNAFPATVGYVPQKPGLILGNIRDNVALGLPPDQVDDRLVWEALDQAEIGEFVRSLPNGINSHVGKNLDSLSGGQLQRLGLARALYLKPRLLVLDEATSALDAETEHSISATLSKLGGSTTLLVVAHRLSTIQHADCVYLLDQGRIVASGDFTQLLVKSERVKKYVDLMSFKG